MQYRCVGKIHGETSEDGLLVFMCSRLSCTKGIRRAFVLHYFDPETGLLKHTSQPYRNPLKGKDNGN
ncbi:hypothetical protein GJ25_gp025 [Mycobacterium phage Hawkeye]|uniref:Uncharacterized protein n=1 Tax=Mycobacterium phage Hawkeye TaxID=1458711 RepID=X2KSL2_9CAUD|nr:hypothetical protein GJ25_gp025 [Mycobacterium phage Hawkeye]AHN84036.1 hypothetical protein PBI_HAWKEYE_25 [Mycobacterium phage Hawkeye]